MAVAGEFAFTVEVDQNVYLPAGGREVSAVVTVTSPEAPADLAGDVSAAELIIVDCSASMGARPGMMTEVGRAVEAAVDVIRDGVGFAIVAGADQARQVYPAEGGLAVAGPDARAAARVAAADLPIGGSAAMGQWLRLACDLFKSSPARVRHAILLTGSRDGESPQELAAAIAYCEGVFGCDCRGVGTDWEVAELRKISTALLGTVDIIVDPGGLAADFEAMMGNAMSKQVADVALRVWTPQLAEVRFVKQVAPTVEDLSARRAMSSTQLWDYPTGAWGPGESRDYHVGIRVRPAGVGQEMLAARISLVAESEMGTQVLGQGLIRALWIDDKALSTKINARVAHYTCQAELAAAIQEGLDARKRDAPDTRRRWR